MSKKRIAMILAVAAILLLAAFSALGPKPVAVRADQAVREDIQSSITTNGQVEPVEQFAAYAPGPTTVRRVHFEQGSSVRRGQLLLELDDADARAQAARALAQVRAAEAELQAMRAGGAQQEVLARQSELVGARAEAEGAQRNLEAMRRLLEKGAASQGEVREAEARLQRAQAALDLLEKQQTGRYSTAELARAEARHAEARAAYDAAQHLLRSSSVASGAAGTLFHLPVRAGDYVQPGQMLAQVADLSRVQVRAFVDEPDLGRLQAGQTVRITWDAVPGRTWEGTVVQTPTTVTLRGTRTVGEVTCRVDNADLRLLPNVNVNVTVITALRPSALTVAREAVYAEGESRYLYEVVDGRLQRRPVETAASNLTRIEITRGIAENAVIAVGAEDGRPLREGLAVRVIPR